MPVIIDKRYLPRDQNVQSRQKFIERNKRAIKEQIKDLINKDSIKDFGKGNKKIIIKKDLLEEPGIDFSQGSGNTERVYVGNKRFKKGQIIPKPQQNSGQGKGKGGSQDGGGEDEFSFILTEKEFSDLFFEDLALPNLIKEGFFLNSFEIQHSGFSRYGGPSSLNIKKTMINALGRRIALKRKNSKLTEEELKKNKKIQYIEDIDLRYNFKDRVENPTKNAVMFCMLDVSGSMLESMKDLAKRFFILLNLFLKRNYERVEVVFVRHAEEASEVDEETFFYSRQTGGTVISSGYKLIDKIIKERFDSNKWNIYIAQATDGDNWDEDNALSQQLLINNLLPVVQYFAYIQIPYIIPQAWRSLQLVGETTFYLLMKEISEKYKQLQVRVVEDYKSIFPVFRSLFENKKRKK